MHLFSMLQDKLPRSNFPYDRTQANARNAMTELFQTTKTLPTAAPKQVNGPTTLSAARPDTSCIKPFQHSGTFKNAKTKSKKNSGL
jgi:hypothetical protein